MRIMLCQKCRAEVTMETAHYIKQMHGTAGVPQRLKTDGTCRLCKKCADEAWKAVQDWMEEGQEQQGRGGENG